MYRETFSVVEAPRLHLLECEGEVAIKGWEEAERVHRRVREGVVRLDVDRLSRQAEKAAQLGIAQAMEALEKTLGRLRRFEKVGVAEEAEEGAPPKATDEERLAVLKLVEKGQITPEEGEMLLDALEG